MRTILVIEDDPNVLDNIHDLLQSEGFFTVGASDGREGLKEAHLRQPDLILCDVMMPDVDGYEVLQQLRRQPETKNIPFIFVTAKISRQDQRMGMDLGADDYLVKPFTSQELLSAVNTRLERHEEQLDWYQERLEEMRSNLSRTLPHELRTPLSCILGYSEFLLEVADSIEPEELTSMLGEINESGKRLERLVENYYLYAQLEVSSTDPDWRSTMLGQGISRPEQVVERLVRRLAERQERVMDLHMSLSSATVRMQDVYLEKIVEELLDNAFKVSPAGSTVRVMGLRDADFYVLEVTDEGRGMTEEQQQFVGAFVQFERKQYEQQGLGLGMTIASRLVELHKGELRIESVPGQGTTVWVWMPLAT
jgi:signal transduction histidine kinase